MPELAEVIAQVRALKLVQLDVARLLELLDHDVSWRQREARTDSLGVEMRAFERSIREDVLALVQTGELVVEFERSLTGLSGSEERIAAPALDLLIQRFVGVVAVSGVLRDHLAAFINVLRAARNDPLLVGIESARN